MQRGDTTDAASLLAFIEYESAHQKKPILGINDKIRIGYFLARYDSVFAIFESMGRYDFQIDLPYFPSDHMPLSRLWAESQIKKNVKDTLEQELFLWLMPGKSAIFRRFDYTEPRIIRWLESPLTPRMRRFLESRGEIGEVPKDWHWGLWLGSSSVFNSGRLSHLLHEYSGIRFQCELRFSKIQLSLHAIAGSARTKDSLPNGAVTLPPRTLLFTQQLGFELGYLLLNTAKFRVVPSAGISNVWIATAPDETKRDSLLGPGGLQKAAPHVDLEIAFKLRSTVFHQYGSSPVEMSWRAISVKYSAIFPEFQTRYHTGGGVRHMICVSVGLGAICKGEKFGRRLRHNIPPGKRMKKQEEFFWPPLPKITH